MSDGVFPLLSMAVLKRAGLVGKRSAEDVTDERMVMLRLPGLFATVVNEDDRKLRCLVMADGVGIEQRVDLTSVRQSYGLRYYFRCPTCRERSIFLTVDDDMLCCVACSLNGMGDQECAEQKVLVARAKAELRSWRPPSKVGKGCRSRLHGNVQSPAIQAASAKDMSTEAALDQGRDGLKFGFVRQFMQYELGNQKYVRGGDYRRPDSVKLITEVPRLDLKVLLRRWPIFEEVVEAAHALRWDEDTRPMLMLKWRGIDLDVAVSHRWWQDTFTPGWQDLLVRRGPNRRHRFVCPVTGKSCDILYLRNGLFASASAQRLVHASQRATGRKRKRVQPDQKPEGENGVG